MSNPTSYKVGPRVGSLVWSSEVAFRSESMSNSRQSEGMLRHVSYWLPDEKRRRSEHGEM